MELGAVWGAVQQGWPHPSRVLVFLYVRDASTAIAPQGSSQVRAQMSAWKCPVRCSIGILMLSCHAPCYNKATRSKLNVQLA